MISAEFLREFEGPFEWGVRDCVYFALAARKRVQDYPGNLPAYSSESEALALVDEAGSMEALVTQHLGEPLGPHLGPDWYTVAEDYDTVLTSFPMGPLLAVASPPHIIAFAEWPDPILKHTRSGYVRLDLRHALRIWPCR